ncbi:alkyl hydroperoxide reductase subunit F [Oecophyllibacter saccharovorans]|uniref:alkyl hydroperoxide reductase subunit F n=1 Tax=Oecophyllibacter saccharovorans TaxID=2558360 RepID=UPI001143C96B|nr:alkyl hydroperoxide reductase subunit F [Oecophyllibacter saccharovorans]QDH15250.1 alkyl hydroperoxide reductase subunit F [Oecophyllibacter saccharovorans]
MSKPLLDDQLKEQLRGYLKLLKDDVLLESTLDSSEASQEINTLLTGIADLSDKVSYSDKGTAELKPSFQIRRVNSDVQVGFAGLPLGHEFPSLVLALLQVGGHPPKIPEPQLEQIRNLKGDHAFQIIFSMTCNNCPDVVQAFNAISVINPDIQVMSIDGAQFPELVKKYDVRSVPQVFQNGKLFSVGRIDLSDILAKLDKAGSAKVAQARVAELNAEKPYDTLIVGQGPAGCAAAIYTARKGLRTGLIGERFGGQIMDTAEIDNFISVPKTEGAILGRHLEEHVKDYPVDIINDQRVDKLVPAVEKGGLHEVHLANGAHLKARTVIAATGARWRQLGIEGEDEYRTRGVAYCPHCDGPFFKGQPVAVAGGGNSGVEAAIDLANLASHVTLLQYDDKLTADEVLQKKLATLPNVTIVLNAATQKIVGDGKKMTGLTWKDRKDGSEHTLDVNAIFVQIGLLPNSAWLEGTVDLSPAREIVTNDRNETSVPGVFGAGDVTTEPYKQIIIAMGSGAIAALAAFDYLIRVPNAE